MLVLYKTKCQLSILNEAKFYCAHKIPSYKNFSGKCVFKWLLIVFSLKISEKRIRLFFSMWIYIRAKAKWTQWLRSQETCLCVCWRFCGGGGARDDCFILTVLWKAAFLLWGSEFRLLLSDPVPSPLGATGQNGVFYLSWATAPAVGASSRAPAITEILI